MGFVHRREEWKPKNKGTDNKEISRRGQQITNCVCVYVREGDMHTHTEGEREKRILLTKVEKDPHTAVSITLE